MCFLWLLPRNNFVVCISWRPRFNDNKIPEENMIEVWCCWGWYYFHTIHTHTNMRKNTFNDCTSLSELVWIYFHFPKHCNRISRIWRTQVVERNGKSVREREKERRREIERTSKGRGRRKANEMERDRVESIEWQAEKKKRVENTYRHLWTRVS